MMDMYLFEVSKHSFLVNQLKSRGNLTWSLGVDVEGVEKR
jgi:hypothetical protein